MVEADPNWVPQGDPTIVGAPPKPAYEAAQTIRSAAAALRDDTCPRADCVSCKGRRESADWLNEYADDVEAGRD